MSPRNLITDVEGLRVGHAEDHAARSGVTVLLSDAPLLAAVDVRGGAPGTRETEALDPVSLGGMVDAITLAGGSVYGLDAAGAVAAWLGARGRGFRFAPEGLPAPIVAGAIIFDLLNGGTKDWGETPPYRTLALDAVARASEDFALGNSGAGIGARAGLYKGGTGSVSATTANGETVGALAIVNAVGSPLIPGTDVFWAFPFERAGEFGGRRPYAVIPDIVSGLPADMKGAPSAAANTTIAVVATDAILSRTELQRLAIMASDGFARALRPVHAPADGDTVFAVSTGKRVLAEPRLRALTELGTLAGDCIARAIARGVYAARTLGTMRSYRDFFPGTGKDVEHGQGG
jgi:L-aminopeptidase/D-esterase-like protein